MLAGGFSFSGEGINTLKFIIFIIILIHNTFANEQEYLKPIFERSYQEDYYPLTCSDNIMRLGKRLLQNNVDLTTAQVIFITHKYVPHVGIKAKKQRLTYKKHQYKALTWTFHAVLLLNDIIFDLDFTEQATPITIKEYMNTMWNQNDLKDYQFQIKFFDEYNSRDFGGRFHDKNYPYLTYKEFYLQFLIE